MPYQLYIRKKEKIEAKFGKLVKVTHLSNGMPETEFKSGGLKPLGLLLLKVLNRHGNAACRSRFRVT